MKKTRPFSKVKACLLTLMVGAVSLSAQTPFGFKKGDTIAILGGGVPDRMQHDGWMETLIQSQTVGLDLEFRNMSLTGDKVADRPRNKGFLDHNRYLKHVKADVIFCFFGYNESYAGENGIEQFKSAYKKMIADYKAAKFNGKDAPRFVLFSPIAHEKVNDPNLALPDNTENNKRLEIYSQAIEAVAKATGGTYVDLYNTSKELYNNSSEALTLNGVHPLEEGNRQLAEVIAKALLGKEVKANSSLEKLREAVKDKSWHWFNRYRATDGNDVWGGRSQLSFVSGQKNYEVLMHELDMIDVMTANRDRGIWAVAKGESYVVDDSNVPPPIKVESNVGGKSKSSNATKEGTVTYMSPEETVSGLKLPEGYEAKVFASEKQFPAMANPVILNVGPKGRLWAAAWPTYPKWEPLKEMNDSLLIFHDDNQDGVADRTTEFAKVHNPTGFTFWNGGVIVASQPDILFLKDTDGDDVADEKTILLTGLDSADTHHAASHLIVGPDGGLYFQSGVFFVNNVETPWRENYKDTSSSMYRLDLRSHKFWRHAPNSPNPHGTTFDYWGYHYATDGTGGRGYQVMPHEQGGFMMRMLYNKKVRPVPSHGIISSAHFPPEVQGDMLVCNAIGFLGMKHYKLEPDPTTGIVNSTEMPDMLVSEKDRNFRPADVKFGSDGAMYVADWSNVIIGHMQHNIRDPNRDHTHGRIYRVTYKGRPLQKVIEVHNKPIPALLDLLKDPVDNTRERARAELSKHSTADVIAATKKWMAQFDPKAKADAHHLLEALWIFQRRHVQNDELLGQLLNSPELNARVAAKTVQHYWTGEADKQAPAPKRKPKYKRPKGLSKDISDKEWKLGKEVFEREGHCMTCHQPNGKGLPKMYPPLAKSEWVTGDTERLIKIALHGMIGEITVNGQKYGMPGTPPMTPFKDLLSKDEEMAAVLTYVRNSFGNKASKITKDMVKKVRSETASKMGFWTAEELLKDHPLKK